MLPIPLAIQIETSHINVCVQLIHSVHHIASRFLYFMQFNFFIEINHILMELKCSNGQRENKAEKKQLPPQCTKRRLVDLLLTFPLILFFINKCWLNAIPRTNCDTYVCYECSTVIVVCRKLCDFIDNDIRIGIAFSRTKMLGE